jgi:hypothetical protein
MPEPGCIVMLRPADCAGGVAPKLPPFTGWTRKRPLRCSVCEATGPGRLRRLSMSGLILSCAKPPGTTIRRPGGSHCIVVGSPSGIGGGEALRLPQVTISDTTERVASSVDTDGRTSAAVRTCDRRPCPGCAALSEAARFHSFLARSYPSGTTRVSPVGAIDLNRRSPAQTRLESSCPGSYGATPRGGWPYGPPLPGTSIMRVHTLEEVPVRRAGQVFVQHHAPP